MSPGIVDLEVRQRAITDLATSVALSAGAGSGKTSVLSSRLIELLKSGIAPSQIAAITFTEKAAGELLVRARDGLERALAETPAGSDDRARLEAALGSLAELTLSTIHSFCRTLLLAESLDSGFAPSTEVVDDEGQARAVRTSLEAWRRGFRERHPALARLVDHLVTDHALREGALAIVRHKDLSLVVDEAPFDDGAAFRELSGLVKELDELAGMCTNPDCKLLEKTRAFRHGLEDLVALPPADAVHAALAEERRCAPGNAGRGGDWPGDSKADFLARVRNGFEEWRSKWLTRLHALLVRDLREHLVPALELHKGHEGIASYDDLLQRAAELLRRGPGARRRLAARFAYILVDEVQDTDPIQAEVAALLTASGEHPAAWHDATPEPGRLFAVGDPKQSIYRFRGADVDTFRRLEGVISREGRKEALEQNFRSVVGIVEWVNHTFAALPDYTPQVAFRLPAELDPVVALVGDKDSEPEAVLRHLMDLRRQGARVMDRETGEPRPLRFSDVMLLLPSWSRAEQIASRLRAAGVPCLVEGGGRFFERDEVRLGLAALRALDDPADSEAIVFVLRGLFGLSHEDLARHRVQGGGWRYTLPSLPAGPVTDALLVLQRLHRRRGLRSFASLLDDLFAASRVLGVWALLPDGPDRLANLDRLRALIREAEAESLSPGEVVQRLRDRSRRRDDKDVSRVDDDGDAVRITTVFKAKGLEAPVVVAMAMSRSPGRSSCVVDHERGTVAVRIKPFEPPGWSERKQDEEAREHAERRRWIYVACTRARDQLVLCVPEGKLLEPDVLARGVPEDLETCDHDGLYPVPEASDESAPRVRVRHLASLPEVERSAEAFPGHDASLETLLKAPPAVGDTEGERFRDETRAAVRAAARESLSWKSVTEAVKHKRVAGHDADAEDRGIGADGGTVVHQVMERLDLTKPGDALLEDAVALCQRMARRHGLAEDDIPKCERVLRRILEHEVIDLARRAPERWREAPFAFSRGKTVVAGTIDLCFPLDETRKRWAVVDWKSHIPEEGTKERARYEEQLKLYGRALLQTLTDEEPLAFLVGPHPELPGPTAAEETLAAVGGGPLASGLEALLQAGLPAPDVVESDLEEADNLPVELAWRGRKLVVLVDAAPEDVGYLEGLGWQVIVGDTIAPDWPDLVLRDVATRFGLSWQDDEEPEVDEETEEAER